MLLNILRPTQCGLRHIDQIASMVEFVRSGGIFSKEELLKFAKDNHYEPESLIRVRRFEDEAYFIHDGHHRCFSIWLAGRDVLDDKEFELSSWQYRQYGEINLNADYMTPHDPRKETRHADFFGFKSEVRKLAENSVEKAIEFIKNNRSRYCGPRDCWHVKDLAPACLLEAEEKEN